jgi:hypothetical protein
MTFSSYCSFAYSALASFRMGMSVSAAFPEREEILICHSPRQISTPELSAHESRLALQAARAGRHRSQSVFLLFPSQGDCRHSA